MTQSTHRIEPGSTGDSLGAAPGHGDGAFGDGLASQLDERWVDLIDSVLKVQAPLARAAVERLRAKHPGATPQQLAEKVYSRYTSLSIATGAGIGGIAALPGIGTVAAVGLTVGEGVSFAETTAFLTLAIAHIHGVDMTDPQARRIVLMAVLGGERGEEIMARALGKQGAQWSSVLGSGGMIPGFVTRQAGRYIRRRVVSRTGRLWLLRLLPFGLGAILGGLGARGIARTVSAALREIFDESPLRDGGLITEPRAGDLEA